MYFFHAGHNLTIATIQLSIHIPMFGVRFLSLSLSLFFRHHKTGKSSLWYRQRRRKCALPSWNPKWVLFNLSWISLVRCETLCSIVSVFGCLECKKFWTNLTERQVKSPESWICKTKTFLWAKLLAHLEDRREQKELEFESHLYFFWPNVCIANLVSTFFRSGDPLLHEYDYWPQFKLRLTNWWIRSERVFLENEHKKLTQSKQFTDWNRETTHWFNRF